MGNWKCDKHGTHMDERSTPCPYCEMAHCKGGEMTDNKAWTGNHRRLAAEMKNAPIAWGRFAFAIFILVLLVLGWYKALVWIVGLLVRYVD